MPEAVGTLIICGPQNVVEEFLPGATGVAWDAIEEIHQHANTGTPFLEVDASLKYMVDEAFSVEGVFEHPLGVQVEIFGDIWIPILKDIALNGSGIEFYGSISHEWGGAFYYLLNPADRFFDCYDLERDGDIHNVKEQWLKLLPKEVVKFKNALTRIFHQLDEF